LGGTVVVTLTIEILRRLEGGFDLFGIEMPAAFGLTRAGLCVLILVVMYGRRAGLLGLLEIDEHWRGWRRWARPARSTAAGAAAGPELPELRVEPTGALVVEGAVKDFSGLRALDKVDLSLKPGEILGLIGPNGSGKTTLLNVISGALAPTAGRIVIDGTDATHWT